jgi:putative transcriptional regulator
MSYQPIEVNRDSLTIMGVPFPDRKSFDRACSGIGTNMFEGYVPTKRQIGYIRDIVLGKMTIEEIISLPIADECKDENE